MRSFNVAGPCNPDRHYMVAPESRLPAARALVDREACFVVRAPRQTGKTTAMRALARQITAEGGRAAVCFSCEGARAFPDDVNGAERVIWSAIDRAAQHDLPVPLRPPPEQKPAAGTLLISQLAAWAAACPRPIVLVFDEIDALEGNGLKSVLCQLQGGHAARPGPFPASVILCGVRDVRDHVAIAGGAVRMRSSSPFNLEEDSLRVGSFTEAEVGALYAQHTADTGQAFTDEAIARAWALTEGQPWLVNAIAREIVEKIRVPLAEPVTFAHVDAARERVIAARATHLDLLLELLWEPPVREVIQPILAGELPHDDLLDRRHGYLADLGLVAPDEPVRIANPIYRESIFRALARGAERAVQVPPGSFVGPDGRLEVRRLLEGFAAFWWEHGDELAGRVDYAMIAPQLVLMAYLHRIVNGEGNIDCEAGIMRKRIDLLIRWPYAGLEGRREVQREAIELKVWRDRDRDRDPAAHGLVQLDAYLGRLGLDEGVLVVFDVRREAQDIEVRTRIEEALTPSGRRVTLLRA